MMQALMHQAAGLASVVVEPSVPKAEVSDPMDQADAILLSLRDVPLFRCGVPSNKLYDAYAIGRPVVSTVAGTVNTEIEEHGVGDPAERGDHLALADAVSRLARTSLLQRQVMAERAILLAQTAYSRQRINAEYDRLLRQEMV